jgi:hypothetical protein
MIRGDPVAISVVKRSRIGGDLVARPLPVTADRKPDARTGDDVATCSSPADAGRLSDDRNLVPNGIPVIACLQVHVSADQRTQVLDSCFLPSL